MVNKVPWTVLRKNLEKRVNEQEEKFYRIEKSTAAILKTIRESKFHTTLDKHMKFNEISEDLNHVHLLITELILSKGTTNVSVKDAHCQTEPIDSTVTQITNEEEAMEQPEIEYYTNNTPENPRNNDEETSYIDNPHPVGTSSPFQARLIINKQQQVTGVDDTFSPRLTPRLSETESSNDITRIPNTVMLDLAMESWEDTSILDNAIHVDFNITIKLVKELQELVNIRIAMDKTESEKQSLKLPEFLAKPKELRQILREMKINKYVSLLMKKSVIEKGRLAQLKPTSRKGKQGKCDRVGMDEKEYELITNITKRAWKHSSTLNPDSIKKAISQCLSNTINKKPDSD